MKLFWLNRGLAVFVWLLHVVSAARNRSDADAFLEGLALILPVALIWMGDAIAARTGLRFGRPGQRRALGTPSGGFVLKAFGWIVLLLPWIWPMLAVLQAPAAKAPRT